MRARKLRFCDEYDTNYLIIAFDDELNRCLKDISLSQNSYVEDMFKVILNNSIKSKTFEKKLFEDYYFNTDRSNKYIINDDDNGSIFLVELYNRNVDTQYERLLVMYFNSFFNTNYTGLFDFFNTRFKMFYIFDELIDIIKFLFESLSNREYPSKECLENLGFTEEVCNNIFDYNFDRHFYNGEYDFKIWRCE